MFAAVRRRTMATMAPKPTSKKSKSRQQLMQGMPVQRLDRKQALNPHQNHVLQANQELSRRERHFRRCIAQAQCATTPHNPDLTHFIAPHWLQSKSIDSRFQQSGPADPAIQSVSHSRLVRSLVASRDPVKRRQLMHRGVVKEDDLKQIQEIELRQVDPDNLPLFDRVISQAKLELELSRQALVGGGDAQPSQVMFKDGIEAVTVKSVVGSAESDIGRAIAHGAGQVSIDYKRETVNRVLGPLTANASQLFRYFVDRVKLAFRKTEFDCGSPQLQGILFC